MSNRQVVHFKMESVLKLGLLSGKHFFEVLQILTLVNGSSHIKFRNVNLLGEEV